MGNAHNIKESELHKLWINQSFSSDLKTLSGSAITVLDVGSFNEDTAGPDFKHSRIRIGNLVYVGDVEIDGDYNNWKSHGHNIDNRHNKVILHVSLINKHNQQYVYTKDGRKVPTICLSNFMQRETIETVSKNLLVEDKSGNGKLRCSVLADKVEYRTKKQFLSKLGIERFNKKCNKCYSRLKELAYLRELNIKEPIIRYDLKPEFEDKKFTHDDFKHRELWQQLFYEMVFEALGYSKNKGIMLSLAQSVNVNFINKLGHDGEFYERVESVLFNVAGMMPDVHNLPENESSDYTKRLAKDWDNIKRIYDGKTFNETQWHFFRLRPQNFPTIRIAGGVRFLDLLLNKDLISTIIKKFKEIRSFNVLINSVRTLFVIRSKGFWKSHYVFDQLAKDEIKYFVGASRADEIVVNVVLPFFTLYFDLFGDKESSKKVLKIYNVYNQRSDNRIVRDVAASLKVNDLLKKTIYTQGMLELFRGYCSKKNCMECEIGKEVFN